jgi:hypothetical protein
VAWPLGALGQQLGKLPLIGVLVSASPPHPFADAFWRGLHALGYSEGRNIKVEFRFPPSSASMADRPVTFPPGRAKLSIRPCCKGAPAGAITIGIVRVAPTAALVARLKWATMTSTPDRRNAAANSSARSIRPSV